MVDNGRRVNGGSTAAMWDCGVVGSEGNGKDGIVVREGAVVRGEVVAGASGGCVHGGEGKGLRATCWDVLDGELSAGRVEGVSCGGRWRRGVRWGQGEWSGSGHRGYGELGGEGRVGGGSGMIGGSSGVWGVVVVVVVCSWCGSGREGVPSHPQVSVPSVRRAVRVQNGEAGYRGGKKPSPVWGPVTMVVEVDSRVENEGKRM